MVSLAPSVHSEPSFTLHGQTEEERVIPADLTPAGGERVWRSETTLSGTSDAGQDAAEEGERRAQSVTSLLDAQFERLGLGSGADSISPGPSSPGEYDPFDTSGIVLPPPRAEEIVPEPPGEQEANYSLSARPVDGGGVRGADMAVVPYSAGPLAPAPMTTAPPAAFTPSVRPSALSPDLVSRLSSVVAFSPQPVATAGTFSPARGVTPQRQTELVSRNLQLIARAQVGRSTATLPPAPPAPLAEMYRQQSASLHQLQTTGGGR